MYVLELPEERYTISNISELINIRELSFSIESTSDQRYSIQPLVFQYPKRLSMANISDGLSRGYVNLCKAVLGDAFVTLKQVAFPYVQGNHVRLLPKRSTSLIDLTIRCCTKHALYLILEKLSNLERFSVDPGTLDVRKIWLVNI